LHYSSKILIVEDIGLIALDLKTMLVSIGFRDIKVVYNGRDAVDYAETNKPDLILMDIILGNGLNGIEAAMEIQKHDSIPLIYITGSTDKGTLKEASETFPAAIINKPVYLPDLETAVKTALGIG
jgi:CheY-like chemotaxis protein